MNTDQIETKTEDGGIIPDPPYIILPAETHLIVESLPMPDPKSNNYLTITCSNNSERVFNFANRKTRNVKISGMTICWDESNDILMSYNENADIESLEIYADTLIVGTALRFPQTNIKIYARIFEFSGKAGSVNTTPIFIEEKPGLTKDGPNGIKGGNIELYISDFKADLQNEKPFILCGTTGQPGGDGKLDKVADMNMKGTPLDRSIQIIGTNHVGGPDVVYCHYEKYVFIPSSGPELCAFTDGAKRWPKDGANAIPAGKPGVGGAGGDLSCTLTDVEKYICLDGGKSGEVGSLTKGQPGGQPSPAFWQIFTRNERKVETHTTKNGLDAEAPAADKTAGDKGSFKYTEGKEYIWLHPLLLQTAVQYFSDTYLNGYYQQTADGLNIYKTALENYKNPSQEYTYRFKQSGSEIQIMLNRLISNTDFFGNPAGWVPMLSFESNLLIYKNEVKDSIQTLYLAYRIRSAIKKEESAKSVLQSSISQLQSEVQKAIQSYSEALEAIPQLNQELSNVSTAITTYTEHLKEVETRLLEKAKTNVRDRHAIKCAFGILSGILNIIPVGQPALGTIGKGLDLISNIDPEKPLDTVGELSTLFAKYAESNLGENAANTKKTVESTNTKDQSKSGESAKKIIDAAKNLEPGLKKISNAIHQYSAPSGEIKAELEKLEAENVEYQQIKKEIEELNEQKIRFVKKLTSVLQQLNNSLNTITGDLLQIDTMHSQLSSVFSALNHDTILYAKKMEQNAIARLVKYQYYMVKSFEYRMLKPCPGVDYQLKYVFDAFVKLLDPTTDGMLTKSHVETLMTTYEEPIKNIASNIITEYNSNIPQLSTEYIVPLSNEQINKLNSKNSVTINLMDMGYWDFKQEGLRIRNFGADEIEIERKKKELKSNEKTRPPEPAIINLMYTHSGFSVLQSKGRLYGFNHKMDNTIIHWGTTYNLKEPRDKRITPIVPSPGTQSILSVLLDPSLQSTDILTQYLPGAWGDITITKDVLPIGSEVNIKKLNLTFKFEFFPVHENEVTLFIRNDNSVSPIISLDKYDLNERKDGRGSFIRIFEKGTTITISAPEESGRFKFSKWLTPKKEIFSSENEIKVKLDSITILESNYDEKDSNIL